MLKSFENDKLLVSWNWYDLVYLYKRVKIQIYTYKSRHLSPFESQKWLYNLCNPINLDLCCALFFPFFLIENKLNSTERGAVENRIERITEITRWIFHSNFTCIYAWSFSKKCNLNEKKVQLKITCEKNHIFIFTNIWFYDLFVSVLGKWRKFTFLFLLSNYYVWKLFCTHNSALKCH